MLDLIDGCDNCPQLTRLLNGGTNTAASFATPNSSSNLPLATPLPTLTFPAPSLVDADFDGSKDLVVVPNPVDNPADRVSMRHSQATSTAGTVATSKLLVSE